MKLGDSGAVLVEFAVILPVLLLLTLYFTYSRGGWIACSVGLVAMIAIDRKRVQLITTALVLAPWPALLLGARRAPGPRTVGASLHAHLHQRAQPRRAPLLGALGIHAQQLASDGKLHLPRAGGDERGDEADVIHVPSLAERSLTPAER